MREAVLAGDEELGERAVSAARTLIQDLGHPVRRSQIKGLLNLACTEADKLAEFAGHQQERAQKRFDSSGQRNERYRQEALFWERIANLCKGTRPRHEWSLNQALEAAFPANLNLPAQPPGARLTREEQEQRKQLREQGDRWKQTWFGDHAAVFFRRFCAEYLMELPADNKENDE
jgi:hypothetical protein